MYEIRGGFFVNVPHIRLFIRELCNCFKIELYNLPHLIININSLIFALLCPVLKIFINLIACYYAEFEGSSTSCLSG